MSKHIKALILALALAVCMLPLQAHAVDSYRYLHVTIDTVWQIFLFLAPLVLAPFAVLMWVYWRRAARQKDESGRSDESR